MASAYAANITANSVRLAIDMYPNKVHDYILRYRIENEHFNINNDEFLEWIIIGSDVDPSGVIEMYYLDLPKLLKPLTNYTFKAYYMPIGGSYELIDTINFTTPDVTRPSASQYLPSFIPAILNQAVYAPDNEGQIMYAGEANNCVACSLATALSILEYREKGTTENFYSVSYIYGNRRLQPWATSEYDGMWPYYTFDQMTEDGTPVWDKIPENWAYKNFPDNRFLEDNFWGYNIAYEDGAATVYNNQSPNVRHCAKIQLLNPKNTAHFYDSQNIAALVQANGYYMMNFYIPDNFYDVGSNGIVPEPDYWAGGAHAMLIIGWKTISETKYWICQNSWGEEWGDNGLCYVPMNWAHSVPHPDEYWDIAGHNWAYDGYSASAKTVSAHVVQAKVYKNGNWHACPVKVYKNGSWHTVPVKIFR